MMTGDGANDCVSFSFYLSLLSLKRKLGFPLVNLMHRIQHLLAQNLHHLFAVFKF